MMTPSLQLNIGAHLTMTPQLQQAIHLLQLSTLDLRREIELAVEHNPMLMLVDTFDDAYELALEDDWSAAENTDSEESFDDAGIDEEREGMLAEGLINPTAPSSGGTEGPDIERNAREETLKDVLYRQASLLPLNDQQQLIADALIDALDERGYLSQPLNELRDGLNAQLREPVSDTDMHTVLGQLQQLEPTGVFARDLSECLLLQLNTLPSDTPLLPQARRLVRQFLEILAAHDFKRLKRRLTLDDESLDEIIAMIRRLDPAPGRLYSSETDNYVIPDLVLRRHPRQGGEVELNPLALPRVSLHDEYVHLIRRGDRSEGNQFLRHHLQEARWLIKSLSSRNDTLLKVGREIIRRQHAFLDHGEEAMKPLVLADIAEVVGLHESTVSRVTTQKYIHTPRGMFELKHFFSSHVGQAGDAHSSTAIRAKLKKLIAQEPPHKPLSDARLVALLAEDDITVARRTVAKYRESMGIPASSERKRLA
ncbi:RNA polymerase factor sigma-54 [Zymobacter sp. IVIA_5232.4 C2]|uniref:RNA polymerase factor sigma-54 n=1 Tax=Zymobacter sp. IVIA_5232.4 C2 TaxID=3394855 RepID=UPI0039C4C0DF